MQSRSRVSSRYRKSRAHFWGAAALSWAGAVAAQESGDAPAVEQKRFVLEAGSCPAELVLDLERLLRIELEGGKYENQSGFEIEVQCAENEVTLSVAVDDRASAKRRIDLSRTAPSVHARVLALAIAELMREHEEQPPRPKPPPPRRPPPPPKPAPPPPPAPKPETPAPIGELEGFFALSQFDVSNEIGLGGGLRFWYLRLAPWHLALDFSGGTLGRDVELGSARLVSASLGARFGYTLRMADWSLRFGAGQRTGMVRISGEVTDSSRAIDGSIVGVFTTALGYFALDSRIGGALRAGLGAELGGVLLPVRGRIQNHDDFGVDGVWAALEFRLSLDF